MDTIVESQNSPFQVGVCAAVVQEHRQFAERKGAELLGMLTTCLFPLSIFCCPRLLSRASCPVPVHMACEPTNQLADLA